MSQRLKCGCGFTLERPTHYCLNCGERNALGCGVYNSSKRVYVFFIGRTKNETISFKKYEDDASQRNLFELVAERIYERRVEEIVVSGESTEMIDEACEHIRNFLFPFRVIQTDEFDSESDFFHELERFVKTKSSLKVITFPPEKKIHGSHSTIIGGREGYSLVLKLASSPYVKKVIPGVIENKNTKGGGVKLKMTRCDDRGNVRALLIDGATVQQLHVITTASSKEEGEEILKILKAII
jgi:hypothetical protein